MAAPFALVQYGNPKGARVRLKKSACPPNRVDGRMPVIYFRWFYPPLSGSLIPFWLALQLTWRLSRLRKHFPFEVIDTHFGFPDGIAGALISLAIGVPFTMTLRGNEPKHSRSRFGRFCMAFALRRAGRIFTVSDRLRQFAIDLGAEAARVRTVPNGIDASVFFPHAREACRRKHNLPLDRPLILSAGALVERKGHHRVVEALRSIRVDGSKVELMIAGGPGPEGQYENDLRTLVQQSGLADSVRFLGAVPAATMAELMSAADVFCLASTNEGWPNVVHEALACGTPVVATDVGAVPAMLQNGRNGILAPVNDPVALRIAIVDALRKDWDRAAIAAWGQSRGWSQVAAEVFAEIQSLIAEQPKNRRLASPPEPISKDIRQCIDG
jgi:glycosyltransferase involved in cell wall biosynthesis